MSFFFYNRAPRAQVFGLHTGGSRVYTKELGVLLKYHAEKYLF